MRNVRLIARLDVKAPNLVKGVQLEGLRKLGDPHDFALKYYRDGIDEIYYEDIVASLYDRNGLFGLIEKTTAEIFVPVTVGGGLRNIDDVSQALRSGADKVAINTAAIKDPELISTVARRFGSQAMVLSVQAKKTSTGWEAYYDNGREHSGLDAVDWARRGEQLGAGELLITSVDRDGTGSGFDIALVKSIADSVSVPVIASGGMGCLEDLTNVVVKAHADAVAIAQVLHYDRFTVEDLRAHCLESDVRVRSEQNDL